ncbi:MAG: DUF2935 domain-containing protein [Firmicutes bacterium]|jgi:hypothetical protein|nr:DUF2935 domain-containing protein [Bacillota bacterium]
MPAPLYDWTMSSLESIEFWAEITSEHPQILLSVLPHLQERYARDLRNFQREFANLADQADNLASRLGTTPGQVPEEVASDMALLVQRARSLNQEFDAFLRELATIYPESELALLIQHMILESRRFEEELNRMEPVLPPQNEPPPTPTLAKFLEDLAYWNRDMQEHAALLRAFLPNITLGDRNTLAQFERNYRSLMLTVRRLREALTLPGQAIGALEAEARRLAMLTRNLTLEFIRFQEDLLSRYLDHASRFLLRHMLKEDRRLLEELRASGYLFFGM